MPDWFTPALIFFGFLGTLLGPLFILLLPDLGKHRALTAMLERLAQKGAGRLAQRSDGPIPVPVFTVEGRRPLLVTPDLPNEDELPGALLLGSPGPFSTRLEVHPREPAARAELTGLQPVALRDALTERAYVVRVQDQQLWEQQLSPRVEPALERLAGLGDKPAFALSLSCERLQLRRLHSPPHDAELEALLVRAAELIDAIVQVAADDPAHRMVPLCHQCGRGFASSECPRECRRCRTTYHRECFDRTGGCTLYPCSCTTAV